MSTAHAGRQTRIKRSAVSVAYDTRAKPRAGGKRRTFTPSPGTSADPVEATVARLTPSGVPAWKLAQAQLLRGRLAELKDEFGLLTSEDIAQLAGGSLKNPSSLATGWARRGKIVAIKAGVGNLYPGFQFDLVTGSPLPVMADLVAVWGTTDPVGLALWCVSPNEWLSGARPVDLLTRDPAGVHAAATRAVEA